MDLMCGVKGAKAAKSIASAQRVISPVLFMTRGVLFLCALSCSLTRAFYRSSNQFSSYANFRWNKRLRGRLVDLD